MNYYSLIKTKKGGCQPLPSHPWFGYPNFSFFDNMDDQPSPLRQLLGHPPSMTSPGKPFRTEESCSSLQRYLLKLLQPPPEGIACHIMKIPALSETA